MQKKVREIASRHDIKRQAEHRPPIGSAGVHDQIGVYGVSAYGTELGW